MNTISTSQLRALLTRALEQLEREGADEVSLDDDFYWDVLWPARYDLEAQPVPTVGSLALDLERLDTATELLPTDIIHLANVLRAIGESRL